MAEHAAENRGVGSSILPLATSPRITPDAGPPHQFKLSRLRISAQRVITDR